MPVMYVLLRELRLKGSYLHHVCLRLYPRDVRLVPAFKLRVPAYEPVI